MFKCFLLIIKITSSLCLLAFFLTKFDFFSIIKILNSTAGFKALLVGACIVFFQSIIIGIRLKFILKLYYYAIELFTAIRIGLIGSFFSQTMISFVGGDAMRVWSLSRLKIPLRTATGAILLDRIIGFVALIILFILTLPFLLNIIETPIIRNNVIILAITSSVAIVIFTLFGILPLKFIKNQYLGLLFDLISNSRYFKNSLVDATISLILSFSLHMLNGITIYSMFYFYDINVNLFWCLVLSAPIMLITMLPISFSGWGVRESVMITGFGLLGIPAEKILATSVTLGLALLLGALPGIFCFLFEKKQNISAIEQPT
jgi:uncharacterized membrane protein YbhN (UPF0104 family)